MAMALIPELMALPNEVKMMVKAHKSLNKLELRSYKLDDRLLDAKHDMAEARRRASILEKQIEKAEGLKVRKKERLRQIAWSLKLKTIPISTELDFEAMMDLNFHFGWFGEIVIQGDEAILEHSLERLLKRERNFHAVKMIGHEHRWRIKDFELSTQKNVLVLYGPFGCIYRRPRTVRRPSLQ